MNSSLKKPQIALGFVGRCCEMGIQIIKSDLDETNKKTARRVGKALR
jgi:hypothetical protein